MKVVYNNCHGYFGLSDKAVLRYAELKGIKLYPEVGTFQGSTYISFWTVPGDQRIHFNYIYIPRHDPILVQIVEELGSEANGINSKLRIACIESGEYCIEEYHGCETVLVY